MSQHGQSDHVSKLSEQLQDESFRSSFASDQSKALSDAGIDEQAIPDGVLDALSSCSSEELSAVAKVRGALMDAGVDQRHIAQIV